MTDHTDETTETEPAPTGGVLGWIHARMPHIALAGVVLSTVLFFMSLPRHAARGSWGDMAEVALHNWWPVLLLLLVGFFARGRTLYHAVAGWFSGYFLAIAIAFLILEPTQDWLGDDSRWQSGVLVPIVEEAAKAIPVLIVYLSIRRAVWMKATVTDFTVLGLAVGGGYAFHEDALFARVLAEGFDGWGLLFPAVVQDPIFAVGHGVWTGLVGMGVGVALARRGRPLAWLPAIAAYAVVTLDHGMINDGRERGALLDGKLPLWLLVVGIVVSLVVEMRVITNSAGGAAAFRSGVGVALGGMRRAPGPKATLVAFKRFVFGLRVLIQQNWFLHTQTVTANAIRKTSAAPDEPEPPTVGSRQRATALVVLAVLAIVAALILWQGDSDTEEVLEQPEDEEDDVDPAPDAEEPVVAAPSDEPSGPDFGDGPDLTEPLLLRWESQDERGETDGVLLVVDADRELRIQGPTLQYREGARSVLCTGPGQDDLLCFGQPAADSLAVAHWSGAVEVPDLPGATGESRRIAGRDGTCVFVPLEEDTSILTCSDDETGLQLLIENRSKLIDGSTTYFRQELVEWSTPTEADFAIPEAARTALDGG